MIDFFLSGKPIKPLASEESILQRSILNTDLIILNHNQNSFGFEFSAVLAPYKKNITYAYKLAGYEDNWHYVSSKKRFATYTNIPPGNYAFIVKAKNKNHIWSTQNASVKISITPPWWATSFAYACYAIMMALCIYLIVKWRTATLLTRQRLLEQSVIQRTTELAVEKNKVEQLLVKKDEEFANISHEFRTPLTLILGFIRQIIANHKQPAKLEQLHIIQNNGSRLLRMVNQLLDIEAFKVKSVSAKTVQDFAATITTLVTAFTPIAQDKDIILKMPTLEKILFEFTVDAFEQIMLNLLSNAIKYTLAGGSITISSMRTSANELKIIVSDTGMGIPQDQLQAIFARFNRIHNTRSDHIVGTGIGLALVKSLVEAHQGKITVDSIVNQGTNFILLFPIINETPINAISPTQTCINDELIAREIKSITVPATRPRNVAPILANSQSNQSTLLLIDDNPDMLDYLSLILQDDYQIICANNGPYALEAAYQEIPDLIISDVMMPDMDGYELVSALRENVMTDHIPIILLTAKSDSESKLKGFNKQADEYLTKPFDENELKIRIKNLLDIREILKKRFSALPSGHNGFQATKNHNNGANENKFLLSLDMAIESMYMDMELRISQIADHLKISERQLFRKLKNTADMNPTEYLRNFRLQKATEQLDQGIKPTVVAFNVGFSSASYFNKCFKAQYRLTPSEYQKRDYMHTS